MKYIWLFLLIILSYSLSAEQWYQSNSLGMPLSAIEGSDKTGWELQVEETGTGETRILFDEGKESRKWVNEKDSSGDKTETLYMEGQFFSSSRYNRAGQLVEEIIKGAGEEILTRRYGYPEESLIIRETYDSDETLRYTERLRLRKDGSLLSLYRQEDKVHQSWGNTSDQETENWRIKQGSGQLTFYNPSGAIQRILELENEKILKEELRQYDANGRLEQSSIEDFTLEEKQVSYYNQDLLIELEEFYRKEILVSRTSFSYTGTELVEKRLTGRGPEQRWVYSYPDPDTVIEEYYLGGEFISRNQIVNGRVIDSQWDNPKESETTE